MTSHLLFAVQRKIIHTERTWANQCHVALEDVDELWEFIARGGADEAAYLGEAVGIGEELALGITLIGHGLKLDDLEDLAVKTRALLEEKCSSTFVGDGEPNVDDEQYRPDDQ